MGGATRPGCRLTISTPFELSDRLHNYTAFELHILQYFAPLLL
jgi:hypothetical protein